MTMLPNNYRMAFCCKCYDFENYFTYLFFTDIYASFFVAQSNEISDEIPKTEMKNVGSKTQHQVKKQHSLNGKKYICKYINYTLLSNVSVEWGSF